MLTNASAPILGFVATSGTGKTTLLKSLISLFKAKNYRLAVIKHSHHDFEIDKPGKDSYELRMSGAEQMLIASKFRWALITENTHNDIDVDLNELLQQLDQKTLDLILVEGFKSEHYPKIELFRAGHSEIPLVTSDPDIIAVATDTQQEFGDKIPTLDLNNTEQIFQFIIQHFDLSKN
jgi:molybdopterin-guanine dinucleotide biosynthesis protein B